MADSKGRSTPYTSVSTWDGHISYYASVKGLRHRVEGRSCSLGQLGIGRGLAPHHQSAQRKQDTEQSLQSHNTVFHAILTLEDRREINIKLLVVSVSSKHTSIKRGVVPGPCTPGT